MKKIETVDQMKRRYERLTRRLGALGMVLQGTITERTITREDPKAAGKEKRYGPYYQWTFKREGRTATVNLTESQAKAYGQAIENHRTLEEITQQMRELSLQILEATTEGVAKRKSNK